MYTLTPRIHRSNLPYQTMRMLIKYFVADLTATQASQLLNIQRKTANHRYRYIREIIVQQDNKDKNIEAGTSKKDTDLLAVTEQEKSIHTKSIPLDLIPLHYQRIITTQDTATRLPSLPTYSGCTGLIDTQRCLYYKLNNCSKKHRYSLSFWSYCKRRLTKFNGIQPHLGLLHIKESQFRFNCQLQKKDMHHELLRVLYNM